MQDEETALEAAISRLVVSDDSAYRCPSTELRTNAYSGRGLFPKHTIPANTTLAQTSNLEPTVAFIYRPYRRREVCQRCFAYDPDGRDKRIQERDAEAGMAWCNSTCRGEWIDDSPKGALEAWRLVESHIRKHSKTKRDPRLTDDDPTSEQVTSAWQDAEHLAEQLIAARQAPTKLNRRLIAANLGRHLDADVITYLLSGILAAQASSWPSLLDLQAGEHLFWSEHDLVAHVDAYLHLVCILPTPLLTSCTPSIILAVISRDAHNSFGLHSLDDDGSEWFGHAIFPSASYFNHACRPNVSKDRIGRKWIFKTNQDVQEATELCISYLGEEGESWNLQKRRSELWKSWRFICACSTCTSESP